MAAGGREEPESDRHIHIHSSRVRQKDVLGGGCPLRRRVPYKSIAVYAPAKDGSFQRCLLADSTQAGWLAVAVDAKTGMLELRERANSDIKGEVVLSCNLKTIGTPSSTGVAP